MGLLYAFPIDESESDFVIIKNDELTLKTYGLPYLFWFYALGILLIIFFMFLAIKGPVLKLMSLGDDTDVLLGQSLLFTISMLPISLLCFFFYEKRIVKKKKQLSMIHKIAGITVSKFKYNLDDSDSFEVTPFHTTPNMARLKGGEESAGFQNKGYFILKLNSQNSRAIQIDRHSRKADLDKLKVLLEKY